MVRNTKPHTALNFLEYNLGLAGKFTFRKQEVIVIVCLLSMYDSMKVQIRHNTVNSNSSSVISGFGAGKRALIKN